MSALVCNGYRLPHAYICVTSNSQLIQFHLTPDRVQQQIYSILKEEKITKLAVQRRLPKVSFDLNFPVVLCSNNGNVYMKMQFNDHDKNNQNNFISFLKNFIIRFSKI
jgi:hypothetical protein